MAANTAGTTCKEVALTASKRHVFRANRSLAARELVPGKSKIGPPGPVALILVAESKTARNWLDPHDYKAFLHLSKTITSAKEGPTQSRRGATRWRVPAQSTQYHVDRRWWPVPTEKTRQLRGRWSRAPDVLRRADHLAQKQLTGYRPSHQ